MCNSRRSLKNAVGRGHHQVDRGWAWAVLIGHFVLLCLTGGHQKCYGIFFVEIQQRYGVSASMTSLVGGVAAACYSLSVAFVMTCALNVISERQSVLIGGVLLTSAAVASSFAESYYVLLLTLGVLAGLATSFMYGVSFVVLGKYFRDRLTLAQAIASAGGSMGGVIMPVTVRTILDEFSFPSGMLIVGGIITHIFICALLFRPVPRWELIEEGDNVNADRIRFLKKNEDGSVVEVPLDVAPLATDAVSVSYSIVISPPAEDSTHEDSEDESVRNHINEKYLFPHYIEYDNTDLASETSEVLPRTAPTSESRLFRKSNQSLAASLSSVLFHRKFSRPDNMSRISEIPGQSMISVEERCSLPESVCLSVSAWGGSHFTLHSLHVDENLTASRGLESHRGFASQMSSIAFSPQVEGDGKRSGFSICKSMVFWGLVVFNTLGVLSCEHGIIYIAPLAREKGVSDTDAAQMIMVVCGLDVVSRLVPGVIANCRLMQPHTMIIVTFLIVGVICQFTSFLTTFHTLLAFSVVFGSLAGVYFSMNAAVIIHFLGKDHFAAAFGFLQLFTGISIAITFPILGILKDISGTYDTSYKYLGASSILAALVLMSLKFISRWEQKHQQTTDGDIDNMSIFTEGKFPSPLQKEFDLETIVDEEEEELRERNAEA